MVLDEVRTHASVESHSSLRAAVWGLLLAFFVIVLPAGVALGAASLARNPRVYIRTSALPTTLPPPSLTRRDHAVSLLQLPTVDYSASGAASGRAIQLYSRATLTKSGIIKQAFLAQLGALGRSGSQRRDSRSLSRLLLAPVGPNSDGPQFVAGTKALISRFASSPQNVPRLDNAAAFLFLHGMVANYPMLMSGLGAANTEVGRALVVLTLLHSIAPNNELVARNFGFVTAIAASSEPVAVSALRPLVKRWPDDWHLRLLLANLYAGVSFPAPMNAIASDLRPVERSGSTDARIAALATLADVSLYESIMERTLSSQISQDEAVTALRLYDSASQLGQDPGLYSGRALALVLLGRYSAAASNQARADGLAPDSLTTLVRGAFIQETAGQSKMMLATARQALRIYSSTWDPAVSDLVFEPSQINLAPGLLDLSLGSDRQTVQNLIVAGGGGLTALTPIARPIDPIVFQSSVSFNAPVELVTAVEAADALAGDPRAILADAAMIQHRFPSFGIVRPSTTHVYEGAARLLAAGPKSVPKMLTLSPALASNGNATLSSLQAAWSLLEYEGTFRSAFQLCQSGERFVQIATMAYECDGTLRFLSGDYTGSSSALKQAVATQARDPMATDANAPLEGAEAAIWADNDTQALALLARGRVDQFGDPQGPETLIELEDKSADLAMRNGDPQAALSQYRHVLASVAKAQKSILPESPDLSTEAVLWTVRQFAENNSGLALISLAQKGGTVCGTRTSARSCLAALGRIKLALASDPDNPYYLMNLGWVQRLIGRVSASERSLIKAAKRGQRLYPVYNDLGVELARSGRWGPAERAFDAALTADPRYPLAAWNLGVANLRLGLARLPWEQAYVARAVASDKGLSHSDLTLRTDESVYEVGDAGGALRPVSPMTKNLGFLAIILSLVTFVLIVTKEMIADRFREVFAKRLRKMSGTFSSWLHAGRGGFVPDEQWQTRQWTAFAITVPVLAVVILWVSWRESGGSFLAAFVVSGIATAIALVVHECGHRLAAMAMATQIQTRYWSLSLPVAIVGALVPLSLAIGPYPGHVVEGAEGPEKAFVQLSGPAANLVAALISFFIYRVYPVPLLALLGAAQLAICSYSLLPFKPLDGAVIKPARLHLLLVLLVCLVSATVEVTILS